MKRGLMAAGALALAMALVAPAWAQVTYKDVTALDFSKTDDQGKMQINGNAAFVDKTTTFRPPAAPRLRLTDDTSQGGTAFLTTSMGLSNYRAIFDLQIQKTEDADTGSSPGDGMAFIVQAVGADFNGGTGGSLGYQNAALQPPNGVTGSGFPFFAPRYSYAVEFNTWANNGLPNVPDTVALDIMGVRTRIGQTAFTGGLTGSGVIRAQIDVTPDGITSTFTGGKIPAATPFVWSTATAFPWKGFFQDPKGSDGNPQPLFFGFGAGTGGARATHEVINFRLQVPA